MAKAPWLVGLTVLALGLGWVWAFGGLIGEGAITACVGIVPETSDYRIETTAWPPGASRCVIDGVAGPLFVPWFDWLVIAFLAGAAALVTRVGSGAVARTARARRR